MIVQMVGEKYVFQKWYMYINKFHHHSGDSILKVKQSIKRMDITGF